MLDNTKNVCCYVGKVDVNILHKVLMTRESLLRKHGIESRASLHTTIDRNLLDEVNKLIPQRKRGQFLESLIRRELKELQAS